LKRAAAVSTAFALLAAASLAAYSHQASSASVSEPASLLSELPPNAPLVAYLDAQPFRSSAFLEQLLALAPSPAPSADYQQFMEQTGFDFSRDLNRLAMAVTPQGSEADVELVAEGTFDQPKIVSYARQHGGSVGSQHGESTILYPSGDHKRQVTLEFLPGGRIRLRSAPVDEQGAAPGESAGNPAAMRQHLAGLSASPLFVVAEVRSWPVNAHLGQYSSVIGGIAWLTVQVLPQGNNLQFSVNGECNSAPEAQQLVSLVNLLKGLGTTLVNQQAAQQKISVSQAHAASDFLRNLEVTQDDTRVMLAFSISTELLKQLPKSPAAASTLIPAPHH
jgi:hypothetical protein